MHADLLACTNGTVWYTHSLKEPRNVAEVFQEQNASKPGLDQVLFGGDTNLWANERIDGFEACKKVKGCFRWIGAKDFNNCANFQWFFLHTKTYFNAKGNVYKISKVSPFYKLVWEMFKFFKRMGEWLRNILMDVC